MRQIQDRGAHNSRQQMKDPNLKMDLQSNLQVDLQKDLQVDLQMDLQTNLQVRTDLQPDLQVQAGHDGTLQPSPLVLFPLPLQVETSTERENLGGTCEQGPNCVTGEDLHSTRIYTLHGSTRIYTLHV